ncbi:MAG: prepilin-type N-terminal cleavage/methylation domain-containing protein [Chitinispirillaceae bacterium]|jgi:prepilin-type N-terminal cleavage/methylation domain-containing protein
MHYSITPFAAKEADGKKKGYFHKSIIALPGWARMQYLNHFLIKGGSMFHQVRKEKGFTLVEVIVVAVIVAVLAAVAIPLYMGYIKDSRINVGNNVAGTISSACGASTQQKVTFATGTFVSPSEPTAPVSLNFASVSDNTVKNTIVIPNDYTAVIADAAPGNSTGTGSVTCYYTDYTATSAKVFTYKQ